MIRQRIRAGRRPWARTEGSGKLSSDLQNAGRPSSVPARRVSSMQSRSHSCVEERAGKRMGGLLVVIFSPIKICQFQCPSPTKLIQFHCPLVGALLLGGVHGFLLGNSRTATLSIPAPRTVTEITRLSVRLFRPGQPLFLQNKQLRVPCCRRRPLGSAGIEAKGKRPIRRWLAGIVAHGCYLAVSPIQLPRHDAPLSVFQVLARPRSRTE
jgi:hypothetical protein